MTWTLFVWVLGAGLAGNPAFSVKGYETPELCESIASAITTPKSKAVCVPADPAKVERKS